MPNSLRSHAAEQPVPFYMYEGAALDHGWLRHCDGFEALRRSAYNERLGEVYLRDALATHPWRTRDAARARLAFVPVWEVRAQIVRVGCTALIARARPRLGRVRVRAGCQLQYWVVQWHDAPEADGERRSGAAPLAAVPYA
jgi:hypothetical protein